MFQRQVQVGRLRCFSAAPRGCARLRSKAFSAIQPEDITSEVLAVQDNLLRSGLDKEQADAIVRNFVPFYLRVATKTDIDKLSSSLTELKKQTDQLELSVSELSKQTVQLELSVSELSKQTGQQEKHLKVWMVAIASISMVVNMGAWELLKKGMSAMTKL